MTISLLILAHAIQAPPPTDWLAQANCRKAATKIEIFVSDYSEYITGLERRGQISYDFAADLEYELELAARPHVRHLNEVGHRRETTSQYCIAYEGWVIDRLTTRITSKRLANFGKQMRERTER